MKTLKTLFFFLNFLIASFLNAQSFEQLKNGEKITGQQTYILPKSSFIIEIPVVTTEIKQGTINFKDLNKDERKVVEKKYGVDLKKFESVKDGNLLPMHSISDDSIKISMTAVPDYDKIIFVSSSSKWNKNQSVNFTYSSDGMLASGESSSENKTYDIVIKALSGIGTIAGAFMKSGVLTDSILLKNDVEIKELTDILTKYDDLDQINNFEIYKDVKSGLEKKYARTFAELFYAEKKKVTKFTVLYTPKKGSTPIGEMPFFTVDAEGNIKFSEDLKNELWGKDISFIPLTNKDVYVLLFKDLSNQQNKHFVARTDKAKGFAYNIPTKVELSIKNKSGKKVFNDIYKVAQFGILGYVDSKKNAKLTYSLDPITGELLKLSVTGTAILTDQVGAAASVVTEGAKLIIGDSDDIKLEKEVKRLELEKKKKELLQALE